LDRPQQPAGDIVLIDVVLPVRNGSAWIAEALDSVLCDSSSLQRIIVVDDGSTDGTASIVRALPEQGKIELIEQGSLGLIAALNRGLAVATAPLVARMDADDISLPGRFEAQTRFLVDNPDIIAVGAQVSYIDDAGHQQAGQTDYPVDPADIALALFSGRCVLSHPTVAMRRDAVLALGGYRPAFEAAEDYDLWLRAAETAKVANLPQTFLRYRRHATQIGTVRKIRQGYSHDLALLCSLERRHGRPDPLANAGHAPNYDPAAEPFTRAPAIFAALAGGYRAIAAMQRLGGPIRDKDLALLPRLAALDLLGEGRKTRRDIVKKAFWVALARGQWQTARHAAPMLAARKDKRRVPDEIEW